MFRYRITVGPLLIAGLLGLLWLDQWLGPIPLPVLAVSERYVLPLDALIGRSELPPGALILLVSLLMAGGASKELAVMLRAKGLAAATPVLWTGAAIGQLLMYLSPGYGPVQPQLAWYGTWLVVVLLIALRGQTLDGQPDGTLTAAGAALLALVYLGTLPGFYLAIRHWHSAWVVSMVVLMTKSGDIGAYFVGKSVGRTKLISWLSPGKTVEGLLGGMGLASAVAVVWVALSHLAEPQPLALAAEQPSGAGLLAVGQALSLIGAAVLGAIIVAVGQAGDLIVSLFKRDAQVKDAEQTIPGFGGVLDLVDSPLLVGPVAYWLLRVLV